jgi:type IV pilus assembly protein PilQ
LFLLFTDALSNDSTITISQQGETFSIQAENVHLSSVISKLAIASGNDVVIHGNCSTMVTLSMSGVSFDKALKVLLNGNSFTYIKKDNIYVVADENIDTLLVPYLTGKSIFRYDRDSSKPLMPYIIDDIPVFLKNPDMLTDERYRLNYSRALEIVNALPSSIIQSHITVDKESNSLLLHGTTEDIDRMKFAIASIDTPRAQIIIEVLIVEFREFNSRDIGLKLRSSNGISYPDLSFTLSGKAAKDLFSGRSGLSKIDFLGDQFYANLNLLISEGKANVLAKPTISVINGHEATVNIGETQYFKVTTGIAENMTSRFQPIQYGLQLKITPVITKNRTIAAEIEPQISNSTKTNNEGYPNVFNRMIKSDVQIEEGKTLVLGGLVRQDEETDNQKIPLLGDIPILGNIFRSRRKDFIKTNLCIYITPHIVNTSDSVSTDIYEKEFDKNKYQRFLNDVKNF